MIQKLHDAFSGYMQYYQSHRRFILVALAGIVSAPIALIVCCHFVIQSYAKYILDANDTRHERMGVVLGAGITKSGKPFKELQARLDTAAEALTAGRVDKLLLSGDNRFSDYNEPEAMKKYLIEQKHISADVLQPDYAGRSTYESCERAAKVFGIHEVIIFSAATHLPRAIYLCRHFGITAYGVSSGVEANNGRRRELLADVKAIFNVYVHGEHTVLGQPIKL